MTRRKDEVNKALEWADAYEQEHPHAAVLAEELRELRVQLASIKAMLVQGAKLPAGRN
jgi:hypothetical protein